MREERRLAAILAADMVGYSRLMGADESGTLKRLKASRGEVIDPEIDRHGGRIVKTTGDGILVEFASAVDAVECALAMQRALADRNVGLPESERMEFRVGINVGDVIVDGDDLYGDGVNVAARLEAIAEPGGLCISGAVFDYVKHKLDLECEDLGGQTLKNIAEPVHVYRVRLSAGKSARDTAASNLQPPDKPSIAVLPFDNMSGDPEQEYFADGIAEDIITSLSKISGLFVIARNSTFTYKGTAVNVPRVSQELGVRYVVEGSVRKAGGRVRITAQLIDGASGGHLWADKFDRELTDIFAVQDEVTEKIVSALALKLTEDERARIAHDGTENVEAYDYFLRGRDQMLRQTSEANAQALVMLERATELDPGFAPAYAILAHASVEKFINRWGEEPERSAALALEAAEKALALDDSEPTAHFAVALASLWMKQQDRSLAAAQRAVEVDPNFAEGHVMLGHVQAFVGRSEQAIEAINRAMRLDPHYPNICLHFLAQAQFHLGRYDEAAASLKRRLIRKPDSDISRVLLASCHGHLGRAEEARAEWDEVFRISPDYSLEHRRQILPYKDPADFEQIVEGLRKAGIEE
jgi:adenylate cyclase